ncbi:MAG: hypothetical protein BJ554DRAFT_6529, partial [Olpidium bornovanus]
CPEPINSGAGGAESASAVFEREAPVESRPTLARSAYELGHGPTLDRDGSTHHSATAAPPPVLARLPASILSQSDLESLRGYRLSIALEADRLAQLLDGAQQLLAKIDATVAAGDSRGNVGDVPLPKRANLLSPSTQKEHLAVEGLLAVASSKRTVAETFPLPRPPPINTVPPEGHRRDCSAYQKSPLTARSGRGGTSAELPEISSNYHSTSIGHYLFRGPSPESAYPPRGPRCSRSPSSGRQRQPSFAFAQDVAGGGPPPPPKVELNFVPSRYQALADSSHRDAAAARVADERRAESDIKHDGRDRFADEARRYDLAGSSSDGRYPAANEETEIARAQPRGRKKWQCKDSHPEVAFAAPEETTTTVHIQPAVEHDSSPMSTFGHQPQYRAVPAAPVAAAGQEQDPSAHLPAGLLPPMASLLGRQMPRFVGPRGGRWEPLPRQPSDAAAAPTLPSFSDSFARFGAYSLLPPPPPPPPSGLLPADMPSQAPPPEPPSSEQQHQHQQPAGLSFSLSPQPSA